MMAIPNFLVQRLILSPMRYQVKGTIMAGEIVMERVIKQLNEDFISTQSYDDAKRIDK